MKLVKKIIQADKLLRSLSICAIFFSMQNFIALGSEDKSNQMHKIKNNYNFEEIYFGNSISFYEYDNFENQLNTFLGLNSVISETSYYPDLSIIKNSEVIRKIYRAKLNDMIVEEIIHFAE
jgi:hypothetical protein